jgi:diguanylate cyclase (GGDEF)-like protein
MTGKTTDNSKSAALIVAFVTLATIWLIDHFSWPGLAFTMLYFVPILIVSWFCGKWAGLLICLCAALAWSVDDFVTEHAYANKLVPYINTAANFFFFILVTYIIKRFRRILYLEKEYANTDFLTKAANGRFFRQMAEIQINQAKRYGRSFSIVYLDLDNFKSINDNFGHSSGDLLLKSVADALKLSVRQVDTVARIGGDEFAILLPESDYNGAELVAWRIQENILKVAQKKNWPVTSSIGVVTCVEPPLSADEMIKWADAVMYRAKTGGKNKICHEECKKGS